MWKSNVGRPTPSTRCYLREWVCSMAWRFHAIDAMLSPWVGLLDGVEVHEGLTSRRESRVASMASRCQHTHRSSRTRTSRSTLIGRRLLM